MAHFVGNPRWKITRSSHQADMYEAMYQEEVTFFARAAGMLGSLGPGSNVSCFA